jgi:hypothetical protein
MQAYTSARITGLCVFWICLSPSPSSSSRWSQLQILFFERDGRWEGIECSSECHATSSLWIILRIFLHGYAKGHSAQSGMFWSNHLRSSLCYLLMFFFAIGEYILFWSHLIWSSLRHISGTCVTQTKSYWRAPSTEFSHIKRTFIKGNTGETSGANFRSLSRSLECNSEVQISISLFLFLALSRFRFRVAVDLSILDLLTHLDVLILRG